MHVNWQNLVQTIRNGQSAFENSGAGTPIDTGALSFYDFPMGDFDQAADDFFVNNPNDFIIGFSKWGSETDVVKK
jgi:hypothetical protein